MKRILALITLVLLTALPLPALAICTQTSITSTDTSTQILAANTSSSAPRRYLSIIAGGACPVWCSVGDTAVVGLGLFVAPGDADVSQNWSVQQPPNSYPQAPNGAVNCILPSNLGCSTTTVSACAN